ncbi:hypothetical protein FN846DRAFT_804935 [Sphaerosporella brunnea]|uniref:VWFA domain-containing protein n=1 Tax=Sphaerosporella brunnea TaxID=1250544 RepID=A0A5J5EEH9_9PEZI|nr:hypothetical protein FN846DRAFT_804935 [Sphaerosporella brunnea]
MSGSVLPAMLSEQHPAAGDASNGAANPQPSKASNDAPNGQASNTASTSYPTAEQIKEYWAQLLEKEKVGIRHLCPDSERQGQAKKAEFMAKTIIDKGCKKEVAVQLSILALYDLVLLVDNSISMGFSENKSRVTTLKATLKQVAGLYQLVSQGYNPNPEKDGEKGGGKGGGIVSVKFLNPYGNKGHGYRDITPGKVNNMVDDVGFRGLTRIGTELLNRILKVYADVTQIKRPLLVVIFTDGEIEGEPDGLLKDVLTNTAAQHAQEDTSRAHLISYQFVAVGDDAGARELLEALDDDEKIGDYIDCLYGEDLDRLAKNPKEKWEILPKLFLGSILEDWEQISWQNTT